MLERHGPCRGWWWRGAGGGRLRGPSLRGGRFRPVPASPAAGHGCFPQPSPHVEGKNVFERKPTLQAARRVGTAVRSSPAFACLRGGGGGGLLQQRLP